MKRASIALVLFLASVATCTFKPHPPSGTMSCGSGSPSCPDGYTCQQGSCWEDGTGPSSPSCAYSGQWCSSDYDCCGSLECCDGRCALSCLLSDGSSCTSSDECVNDCCNGRCASSCSSTTSKPDGSRCSDDAECVNYCCNGTCQYSSSCLKPDGSRCSDDDECVNYCCNGMCEYSSSCLKPDGSRCSDDDECQNYCCNGTCQKYSSCTASGYGGASGTGGAKGSGGTTAGGYGGVSGFGGTKGSGGTTAGGYGGVSGFGGTKGSGGTTAGGYGGVGGTGGTKGSGGTTAGSYGGVSGTGGANGSGGVVGTGGSKGDGGAGILVRGESRRWNITTSVTVHNNNATLTKSAVLLPVPQTNIYQDVAQYQLGAGTLLAVPDSDDSYLRFSSTTGLPAPGASATYTIAYDVTLYALRVDFSRVTDTQPYDTNSLVYSRYTGPRGSYVDPNNATIAAISNTLATSNSDVLGYARAAYEYVGSHYTYRPSPTGLNTLAEILAAGGGDCKNLTSVYVSLLRRRGIPARVLLTMRPDNTPHVWADFLLQGYGWIPVDVTYKQGDPAGDYFGRVALGSNGIIMGTQVGLTLDLGESTVQLDSLQTFYWWYWCSRSDSLPSASYTLASVPYP
jgi:hypothetical protein